MISWEPNKWSVFYISWLFFATICALSDAFLRTQFITGTATDLSLRTSKRKRVSYIPTFFQKRLTVFSPYSTKLSPLSSSLTSSNIDPLLYRILLRQDNKGNNDGDNGGRLQYGSVLAASEGINVWRSVLLKGRLPAAIDFEEMRIACWPEEPLFAALTNVMAELQLPRFVLRHPETVSAVVISMVRLSAQFTKQEQALIQRKKEEIAEAEQEDEDDEGWKSLLEDKWTDYGDDDQDNKKDESPEEQVSLEMSLSGEERQQLAFDLVTSELSNSWGGVIGGVQVLDQLFGMNHGLLDIQDNGGAGFGFSDGIWQHSGWKLVPSLQREIAAMPELRELIQMLGRRATAEQSDSVHRFVPRKLDDQGALGAQYDPSQRTSVRGITLSGSLSEMLPSEAVLLAQTNGQGEKNRSLQSALRRLFLAKMAESKLLSYQSSGWQDVPSVSIFKPRYLSRLPSAPGGPIMVCLDTSWSMTGRREHLSKALVLACVSAAHKQKREIQIVAFSSARNIMETGPITADREGVQRLLEFLSSSFGGGTDVTGALKHAMSVTSSQPGSEETTRQHSRMTEINHMSAADILLVTDGEIPDPPVSETVMEALDRLKHRSGVQVHGLLVGKTESIPLARLCTHIHDFLVGYDSFIPNGRGGMSQKAAPLNALQHHRDGNYLSFPRRRSLKRYGWQSCRASSSRALRIPCLTELKAKKRSGGKRNRYDDDSDDFDYVIDDDLYIEDRREYDSQATASATTISHSFSNQIEEATELLRKSVAASIDSQRWTASVLDAEKSSLKSCWQYRGELEAAVERVAEGLIEREEEARLVVLGMVSREHILFLGPPGTAKSVLGRRLSQLCGGPFFQRLLTRFTTPEEIFGPLSLRALENDEYKRKTDGFLPQASVAFLDEIFKANSAILNTLLTILNERQFDNGAGLREDCPIRCVVGASNELPESDELDALYDRFLLRKEVLPISDEGVMRMLRIQQPGHSSCDSDSIVSPADKTDMCESVFSDDLDQIIQSISIAADQVSLDEDTCALMRDLRTFMRDEMNVDISDRRLVKAARLLRTSAACHGRIKVDPLDCLLLQHTMWRLPEERGALREWLWNHITPGSSSLELNDETLESAAKSSMRQFHVFLDGLRQEAIEAVRTTGGDVSGDAGGRSSDIAAIKAIAREVAHIGSVLQQRAYTLSRHAELLSRAEDHLWLDPDEARAAKQILLPRAEAFSNQVERVLEDCLSLEELLTKAEAVPNDTRVLVIENLWDENGIATVEFSEAALSMPMKEAKAKYDLETFRKWKRAHRKYMDKISS